MTSPVHGSFRKGDIQQREKLTLAMPPMELLGHSGYSTDRRWCQPWHPHCPAPPQALICAWAVFPCTGHCPSLQTSHTTTPRPGKEAALYDNITAFSSVPTSIS